MNNVRMEQLSETKKKIITVSLELFSKQGFKGTSIRQIANEVGIKGSSIYNHFKGKDEILECIFSMYRPQSLRSKLLNNEFIEQIKSNPDYFISIFETEIRHLYENQYWNKVYKLIIMEMFQNKSIETLMKQKVLRDAKEAFEFFFNELKKHKVISDIDSSILVNELFSLIMFSNIEILLENNNNLEQFITLIKKRLEFLWDSIKISDTY